MRTNVLVHRALRICTVLPAQDGLSDALFNAGVRIQEHCLNLTEAVNYIRAMDVALESYDFEEFKELVYGNEKDDGSRGLNWVGLKAKYGETTDKGLTPEMAFERRHWI